MAVRRACGDLDVPRYHPAGKDHHHEVVRGEVVCTAHDALRGPGPVRVPDVDGAPVDGLAVLLRLGRHRQHAADDKWTGDLAPRTFEGLQLEPERGELPGEVLGRQVR